MTYISTSRYEKRALLGEGGMGRVSLAFDTLLGREVALKELTAADAGVAAFKQEYWWMTRLRHPSLVEAYEFGVDDTGLPFFTMEIVDGLALDAALPMPPDRVRDVLRQLCRVLRYIHREGLVHGDLKLDNCRLQPDGGVKLLDFGLMTRGGTSDTLSGTLAYMAPELIRRAPYDQRADLYALGVLAYQLLTGRLPFEEPTTAALLRAHLEQPPLPPSRHVRELEQRWDTLVMKLLAKEPAERYLSAGEVLAALGETVSDEQASLLRSPFVGRQEALAAFDAALAAVQEDRKGHSVQLTGVQGLGKSRLLDEFALKAQLAGVPVLRGQAGTLGAAPYEPFVHVLRQAWATLGQLDDQVLEVQAPALQSIVPELVALSTAHRLEPQQEKLRLQAAVGELLTALAQSRHQGLVLLLDNWHLADALSRELLAVLQRHFVGQPVLLVLASTEGEEAGFDPWPLTPLAQPDLGRMLGAMLGADSVPRPFLEQIGELTGRVPAAVEDLLGHIVASGRLPQREGHWVLDALPPEALPAGAEAVLNERLGALSPLERRILELAGVVGREFTLDLALALLPNEAPEALYEALASLEHAQWLSHHDGAYAATHDHLGRLLTHALPTEAFKAWHGRVAAWLEQEKPVGPAESRSDAQVLRLAHHFLLSADAERAIAYSLQAAQRTAALFDNEAARGYLQQGLALLDTWPEAPAATRAAYFALLGDLHRIGGHCPAADEAYATALPLAQAAGDDEAVARLMVGQGLVQQMLGQVEAALALFKAALPLCRALPVAREELRCLGAMGRAYYSAGDQLRSQATYEEALMRARTVGDLAYAGEALGFLGLLHVSAEPVPGAASRVDAGLECLHQAIHIKEAIGDKLGLNDSYMLLGNAQLALGDLPGAEHSFLRNQAICREIGAFEEVFASLNLGLVSIERGDHLAALDQIQKAVDLAAPRDNHFALGLAASLEARALLHLGMLERPLPLLEQTLADAREADDAYWELFALVALVEVQWRLGRLEDAQDSLLAALDVQAASGVSEFNLVLPFFKATLAMRMGHIEPAESTFREALTRAEAREAQVWEAHICLGLAELALTTGALHEAARWVTRALDRASVADALELVASSHFLRGRIARTGGDFVEADSHFQRALEGAVQLNLLDLTARVWYERGVLQYPSPQAAKLLKRAQDAMVQQVEGLPDDVRGTFLAADDRLAIYLNELPGQAVSELSVDDPAVDGALSDARQTISQQRLWLDELQHACGLLLKQLDFSQAIARSSEPSHVLTQALSLLLEISRGERGEIFTLEGDRLVSRARKQLSGPTPIDEDYTHHTSALNQALESGELVYIPDTDLLPEPPRLAGGRSVLALPILDEQERVGVMLVLAHPDDASGLMKRELDALRVLSGQLGTALRTMRMQAEWREKTQRLEMLYTLSASLTSTLVMDEVLDLVVKLALEISHAERGFLLLLDSAGELQCQAARHSLGAMAPPTGKESYSQSICRRVLETGESICVEDLQDDQTLRNQKSIQDLNIRTVMCVPLRVKHKALGVLYVDSRLVVKSFSGRDLELMQSIASHASIALENARLYNMATVDSLTQLYFRSHFEQRMREELMRAHRYSGPLSIMMMDIDHFKRFNDTYGHGVGDQVLRHVADIIKSGVRQDVDIPARYGGEEIVVLLPETDAEGARVFAERIRKAIDETLMSAGGHEALHVTISIGIATYPEHAATGLELMERADKALYASKHAGRNTVTVYTPELGG